MKTEADLKKLTEFAAEFLRLPESDHEATRWKVDVGFKPDWHISEKSFFEGWFAPYLAHLAKREMEKRNIRWQISYTSVNAELEYVVEFYGNHTQDNIYGTATDKSEFIALWSAIEAIGEK